MVGQHVAARAVPPAEPEPDARVGTKMANPMDAPGDDAAPGTPGTGENLCPDCNGSGRLEGRECPTCVGTGKVVQGIGGG